MPKHFFFDLDDTLTPSRSPMSEAHARVFEQLCNIADVIVVSGAQESQMITQLPHGNTMRFFMLTQNGNRAIGPDNQLLWSESFNSEQEVLIHELIEKWKASLNIDVDNENDLVEHRGSQISYSLIGHEENRDKKAAFDVGGVLRKALLVNRADDVKRLTDAGVEVTVAGTTCLDFFQLGKNKGFHVARLVEKMNWNRDECIYIGDALEPGRNDETVIGVIPTHAVKNPEETFSFISSMLS